MAVRFALSALALLFSLPWLAKSQSILTGSATGGVRILNTDMAVLEAGETRKDLPCTVTPVRPTLGFDLRFHAGYDITIPLRELAGSENLLTILFRVTSVTRKDDPVYFVHRIRVPEIAEDAKGDAYLSGTFDLGEGKYRVEWLMRDRTERVCAHSWEAEASLPARERQVQLAIAPGEIQATQKEVFEDEPPVARVQTEPPLNVKVLLNFAPQDTRSAALQPLDTAALVSILRSIAREPRIGKFTLVAFNLQEQKVLHRQDNADKIDFPKLGEALNNLKLGTVDLQRLANKRGESEFLANLIRQELGEDKSPRDAVIFAGPKAMLESGLQPEMLRDIGEVQVPVFYMNYNSNPQAVPWRDSIGNAVKFFKGYEYTISRPRDLWVAISEMVSRIVNFKHGRSAASPVSQ